MTDETQDQTVTAAPTAAQGPETTDLSSRTIVMLVVLTLVISFLGAWMNLHQALAFGSAPDTTTTATPTSTAKVSLFIDHEPPKQADSAGFVAFNIQRKP